MLKTLKSTKVTEKKEPVNHKVDQMVKKEKCLYLFSLFFYFPSEK